MFDSCYAFMNHTVSEHCAIELTSSVVSSYMHFIGWPRSGSLLLAVRLDAHPLMSIANKFDTTTAFFNFSATDEDAHHLSLRLAALQFLTH